MTTAVAERVPARLDDASWAQLIEAASATPRLSPLMDLDLQEIGLTGEWRGFGMEIEFVDGNADEIARELHRRGLSKYSHRAGYHTKEHDSWVYESDSTVTGHISTGSCRCEDGCECERDCRCDYGHDHCPCRYACQHDTDERLCPCDDYCPHLYYDEGGEYTRKHCPCAKGCVHPVRQRYCPCSMLGCRHECPCAGGCECPQRCRCQDGCDCTETVSSGGELVTPIMRGTPQGWSDLRDALEIITEGGGRSSNAASCHISISTHRWGRMVTRYMRLMRLWQRTQPLWFTLCAAGSTAHRRNGYCRALEQHSLADIGEDWTTADLSEYFGTRYMAINLSNINDGKDAYVEMRAPDCSLDLGVMQTQAALLLALFTAVERLDDDTIDLLPSAEGYTYRAPQDEMLRALLPLLFPDGRERSAELRLQTMRLYLMNIPHNEVYR